MWDKLSATFVRGLKKPGNFGDGGGLVLQSTANKAGGVTKSWLFRYQINKRQRYMGLGSSRTVSLAEARLRANEARSLLARGGLFGVDLVPDLPVWKEYRNKVRFRGLRRGGKSRITLVESVRQDRTKKLTLFDQEYIEQRGRERKSRRFSLVFRTLTVPQMTRRLENAGFRIKAVLGDYSGQPWDPRADVWLILAEKC